MSTSVTLNSVPLGQLYYVSVKGENCKGQDSTIVSNSINTPIVQGIYLLLLLIPIAIMYSISILLLIWYSSTIYIVPRNGFVSPSFPSPIFCNTPLSTMNVIWGSFLESPTLYELCVTNLNDTNNMNSCNALLVNSTSSSSTGISVVVGSTYNVSVRGFNCEGAGIPVSARVVVTPTCKYFQYLLWLLYFAGIDLLPILITRSLLPK